MKNQREKALETFKAQSIKQDPISWHLWKKAFDEGVRYQEQLVKNNGVLDDVIGSECKHLKKYWTIDPYDQKCFKCSDCGHYL